MADFTVGPTLFPVGATVGAYDRRLLVREQGGPIGAPITTGVVGADQRVTFSGLTYSSDFWAAAEVAGRWEKVAFSTGKDPAQVPLTLANVPVSSVAGKTGAVSLAKGDVGLANVDNTSDAGKPVSTAQQAALEARDAALTTQVGRTAYNAKNYGLVGDGSTADQAAMTAMWPEIPVGARLHLPRGEYTPSAFNLPPSKLEIVGDGPGATMLKVAPASTLAGGLLQWTDASDVIVRDLAIDLNKANTPDGGADGAQMAVYFHTTVATRRCVLERVRVLNGERHGVVIGAAASGLPVEVDLIDVDVEDCDSIGLFASYVTRSKVVRGNYLRNGLDNIQFLRSSGFAWEEVAAHGSLNGHGAVAGDMCSDYRVIGGDANDNAQSGWVASVRNTAFQWLGPRAKGNGQMGGTVDVRNHNTSLTAGIGTTETTIPVASTADHATSGTIRIGTERITYTGITATSFTGATRGAEGSVAQSHLSGATVLSEVFHTTDGVVEGYLLSANGSHGLYHQYGNDLTIGGGSCRGNTGDGMLVVARRATITGLNSHSNIGRGLAFENDAGGSGTGDHRVRGCRLYINTAADYEDNASDTSLADLDGSGTPEGAVKAAVGSTYRRKGGGAGTSFYVKETGTGNTGWVAK